MDTGHLANRTNGWLVGPDPDNWGTPPTAFLVLHALSGGQTRPAVQILPGPGTRRGPPFLALGIGLGRLPHHGASRRLSPSKIRVPEDVPLPVLRDSRGSAVSD